MVFYGVNPVIEALRSSRLPERIVIAAGKDNPRLLIVRRLAGEKGVAVEEHEHLEQLCRSKEHQGVCAWASGFDRGELSELPPEVDRLVMLDGLQDPHNFGAALRVCETFGCRHVVYHSGNSCGLTAAAIKASAGAAFHLTLYETRLNRAVKRLQEQECRLIVLEAKGDATIFEAELPPRWCLVVGSEGRGVRTAIRRQGDAVVRIPIHGRVNSLNVSCALSAALCEFSRRGPVPSAEGPASG